MQNYLEKVRMFADEAAVRKWKVEGKIKNLYGVQEDREGAIKVIRRKTKQRKSKSDKSEGEVHEELRGSSGSDVTEIQEDKILIGTFTRSGKGKPMQEIGGPYGLIANGLTTAARNLGVGKGKRFHGVLSYIRRNGIRVTPTWIELAGEIQPNPHRHFVQTMGGRTGFFQYFDCITEAPFTIYIEEFKQIPIKSTAEFQRVKEQVKELPMDTGVLAKDELLTLFGMLEKVPLGPKSRASIELTNVELVENRIDAHNLEPPHTN